MLLLWSKTCHQNWIPNKKTVSAFDPICLQVFSLFCQFNSLPNDKILDWFKLKAFADNKINLAQKSKFIYGRVENIVGKGENAGYQRFLLFPQCFQTLSCSVVKSRVCVVIEN